MPRMTPRTIMGDAALIDTSAVAPMRQARHVLRRHLDLGDEMRHVGDSRQDRARRHDVTARHSYFRDRPGLRRLDRATSRRVPRTPSPPR